MPQDGSDQDKAQRGAVPRTRVAVARTSVVVGIVLLILILIFIFQNLDEVRVSFLSFHGSFPLAASLFFAAIVGALIAHFLGTLRILQLRRAARRNVQSQPPS